MAPPRQSRTSCLVSLAERTSRRSSVSFVWDCSLHSVALRTQPSLGPSSETPTTNSQLPTAPNTSMSEFNWLGLPPPSSPSASTGKGKESAKKSKRSLTKGHSLASVESGGTKNRDEDSAQNEPESQDSTFMLGSDEESSSYYTDERAWWRCWWKAEEEKACS